MKDETEGIPEGRFGARCRLGQNNVVFLNMVMIAQAKKGVVYSVLKSVRKTLEYINEFGNRDYSFMRL